MFCYRFYSALFEQVFMIFYCEWAQVLDCSLQIVKHWSSNATGLEPLAHVGYYRSKWLIAEKHIPNVVSPFVFELSQVKDEGAWEYTLSNVVSNSLHVRSVAYPADP